MSTWFWRGMQEEFHEHYPGVDGLWESINNLSRTQFKTLYLLVLGYHRMGTPMLRYSAAVSLEHYLCNHPGSHGLHCTQAQKWRDQDSPLFLLWSSAMDILMEMYFKDIIDAMLEACETAKASLTQVPGVLLDV